MMKLRAGFWLVTLGFCVYWALAVLGRERAEILLIGGALLAPLLPYGRQRRWLLLAAPLGMAMDAAWHYAGVVAYVGQPALPLWAGALWLTFSCWWYWLLPQLQSTLMALAVAGAIGGPLTGLAGWQLQAIAPGIAPQLMLLVLSASWAVYLPLISYPLLKR
ncbi:MAG: DUF2878 domain-containing protein [Gibbsiella quercinecans]|uniref:DUF2878 domain-containing protein n=1 Tax=Gibbsiella quercinecans TaxID=929813 RepID=UPI003F3C7504